MMNTGKRKPGKSLKTTGPKKAIKFPCPIVPIVLFQLTFGQTPVPCESPPLWQGWHHYYDPTDGAVYDAEYYEDQMKLRKAWVFSYTQNNMPVNERVVQIYDPQNPQLPGTQFTIYSNNNTCYETMTSGGWEGHGIPKNAQFVSEEYYGSSAIPGAGFLANTWLNQYTTGFHYRTYSSKGCVPVQEFQVNNVTGDVAYINWYDVVIGITNENVFVPPSYCPE